MVESEKQVCREIHVLSETTPVSRHNIMKQGAQSNG